MKKRILSFLLALVMMGGLIPVISIPANAATYTPGTSAGEYVIPVTGDCVNLNPTLYTFTDSEENHEHVPFSSYTNEGKRPHYQPEHSTADDKAYRSTAYVYCLGDDA